MIVDENPTATQWLRFRAAHARVTHIGQRILRLHCGNILLHPPGERAYNSPHWEPKESRKWKVDRSRAEARPLVYSLLSPLSCSGPEGAGGMGSQRSHSAGSGARQPSSRGERFAAESPTTDGQSPPPLPPLPKGGSYEVPPLSKGVVLEFLSYSLNDRRSFGVGLPTPPRGRRGNAASNREPSRLVRPLRAASGRAAGSGDPRRTGPRPVHPETEWLPSGSKLRAVVRRGQETHAQRAQGRLVNINNRNPIANRSRSLLGGLIAFLILSGLSVPARAQTDTQAGAPRPKLKVLLKPVKPFVMLRGTRHEGYSVDLWRRVAQEAGLDFEFEVVETVPAMLERLEQKQDDVGVGALSITARREDRIDFSHPFYESGLQILTYDKGSSQFLAIIIGLFKSDTLVVLGILFTALVLNAHFLWFFERKHNPEMFPATYMAGVWEAAWWSICSFITGGCENKAPEGLLGRVVAMIWMLAGACSFSYITATIATTMTVNTLAGDIRSLNDLRMKHVGTVAGSTSESFLKEHDVVAESFPDIDDAFNRLLKRQVDAVVYDAPMLRYLLNNNPGTRLRLVEGLFDRQGYGFGLQQNSPYREKINRALLTLEEEGDVDDLQKRWFGSTDQ